MSDKYPPAPETDAASQGELTQEEQSALQNALTDLPTPPIRADFNKGLLAALTSGRDFAPWWRQILARLGWMLLPAILGCLVGVGLIHTWLPSRFRQRTVVSYNRPLINPALNI